MDVISKTTDESPEWPTISVVVLNYNGKDHLEHCLPSVLALDYPDNRIERILVDNASLDGSAEYAEAAFPQVKILRTPRNLGFAGGNNWGAKQASGEYLAFLNNDTRVDTQWLRELVKPMLRDKRIVATSSKIVDWEGKTIDFVGAMMNFHGFAFQEDFGAKDGIHYQEDRPLLFSCGGSMLINRRLFLDIEGFDEDYFIYFEDVDLGWRLWLMGYQVWLAPKAITYHRHHATMDHFADYRKALLYERNALYTLFKNYSEENLNRVLPVALLMTVKRALSQAVLSGTNLGSYHITSMDNKGGMETVTKATIAGLTAMEEFSQQLPHLVKKRNRIQQKRVRSDDEIFDLFKQPLRPFRIGQPTLDSAYAQNQLEVSKVFQVTDLFRKVNRKVLVISPDLFPLPGLPTTGSGLRAWGLAQGLASRGHKVILSMPEAALQGREKQIPPEILATAWKVGKLEELIESITPDVVLFCGWSTLNNLQREIPIPIAIDQHGPHIMERTFQKYQNYETNAQEKRQSMSRADFFTCAGQKQRLYFLPWLMESGFPMDENRVGVIPVSLTPDLPLHNPAEGEITFVYGGVFLPWQDPTLPLMTLVDRLEAQGHGVLRFFGGEHPFIPLDTRSFQRLKEQLNKSPRVITSPIISRDELLNIYGQAHVAFDVMKINTERELAFTTRTVEYLWCGLPVIYNNYSELSDYIRDYDAGWTVNPEDREAIAAVVDEIIGHPDVLTRKSANAQKLVRDYFTWDKTIEPLDAFIRTPSIRKNKVTQMGACLQTMPSVLSGLPQRSLGEFLDKSLFYFRQGGISLLTRKSFQFFRKKWPK